MSLQGTFNTAVQAMNSQSQNLSNISTNIANVNTTAYKAQSTHFQTLLNHIRPSGKSFLTVNTVDYRDVDKQGIIATTTRAYDVAISGRGFLVTNPPQDGTGGFQFTRDGAFFGKAIDLGVDTDGNGVNDQGTLLTTGNGNYVYGWAADSDGNIAETNSLSTLTPVMFNNNAIFPSKATTSISLQANLSAADTGRQSVALPYVDQEGHSRSIIVGFNATLGVNEWTLDMESRDLDNQLVPVTFSPPTIAFDGVGHVDPLIGGLVDVTINDASGPQSLTLDLNRMTQFGAGGSLSVQNIEQNGHLTGTLDRTYFNKNAVLIGSYSNGEVRNLYKLPIAKFAADNNLDVRPGNVFVATREAGEMKLTGLGTTGPTHIVVGALEQSTVDLADQFSKMIVTQKAYSSAATVLRTADEMTQAARDLKR